MRPPFARRILAGVATWAFAGLLPAADYQSDVRPILKNRCFSCHGPVTQKAGLRLDAGKLIHRGGSDGVVIVPGKGAESRLIHRIAASDPDERMPPEGGALTADEISVISAWIDRGAPFPDDERIVESPREHWSFQPVKRPAIPGVKEVNWPRNPIDHFVMAKLEERGRGPAGKAPPGTLLRRVYLDLIGFPPTPEEQAAFAGSPELDRVVDELLARSGYGERWGRHWLDAVRYADTNGYERDATKPMVWRYRDWVIEALNADMPYDRFLVEQLAGDELPDADAGTMIATGYLRLGHWDDEPADPPTDRYDQLDDIISTTSQAMLGLTMGCARCHDHKFEPLSQGDYYSMVAIFNPLERPRNGRTELAVSVGTRGQLAALGKRDKAIAELSGGIASRMAAFRTNYLGSGKSRLPEDIVEAFLAEPSKRSAAQKELVKDNQEKLDREIGAAMPKVVRVEIQQRESRIAELRSETPDLPKAYLWQEKSNRPPPTHVLIRGSAGRHGEEVGAAVPVVLVESQPAFPDPDQYTSRRRLGLARWIASPENPLAARVIVNRVWKHHFGEGLVRTPNDFGLMGEPPTHPELLDWLADWFVSEAGWSLKELHRLILGSAAWRMESRASDRRHAETDPDNRFLGRQNYRRLEVEAIRDSVLAVSGQLNHEMFGPHMYPSVPPEALEGHSDPEKIWEPLDETSASRRTIYAFVKRSLMPPILEVLDLCDTTQSSPGRRVTTVAPQALTLFNGEFVNRQARHFADRLRAEAGEEPEAQIDHAFTIALCREPRAVEKKAALEFLKEESLEQFCRVVFNMNEFVYPE